MFWGGMKNSHVKAKGLIHNVCKINPNQAG